jgi:hypothetical protein
VVQAAVLKGEAAPSIQFLVSVGSPRWASPEVLFQAPQAYVEEVRYPVELVAENTCVDPDDVRFSL